MKTALLLITLVTNFCFGQTLCDLNVATRDGVADYWNKNYGATESILDSDSITLMMSNNKSYVMCNFSDNTLRSINLYTNDPAIVKMIKSSIRKGEWFEFDGTGIKGLILECKNDVFLLKEKPSDGYKNVWTIFYGIEEK